jgi:carbon monoxide dehydrogenase subunit G
MFYLGIAALLIALALAGFLLYASRRPDTFRVQRTARVNAPAEAIFPLINDYRNWALWSPYEHRDPALQRTFSGPPAGPGAIYAWEGNRNVGSGRMEIVDTAPPNRVIIKLDFFKPFKASNVAEFTLESRGAATDVTWAMHGPVPLLGKVMHMIIDCDKMVGKDFADGLASMKAAAERQVQPSAA